jgi:methionyl-tRNA formyltransferase
MGRNDGANTGFRIFKLAKYVPVHINRQVNIMVLCNNEIAFPAMQQLFVTGSLKAVVIPEKNKELFSMLQPLLAGTEVTLVSVHKKNLETTISTLIAVKKITAVWLMTFSYIIPSSLLSVLPGCFINFHYGLLPAYRGPNPILAQMLQYEKYSGITVHVVDENIDTGPVVMQQKILIEDTDTFGIQCRKLGMLGAAIVPQLIPVLSTGTVIPSLLQDESQARYFKKPTAADLMINWKSMKSDQVVRMINACNPWNKGAGAIVNNQVICLTNAEITEDSIQQECQPGTIVSLDNKEGLKIFCLDNRIIRVNIIYTPDGFFPGNKLAAYGIKLKDRFIS